ncbi:CdvA-like protein [[Eubacterium] cellulosolvens]
MMAEKIIQFIGKTIHDTHSRTVGKLIGYYANIKNEVTSIEIEKCNGDILNCPISQMEIDGDTITYIHPWEYEANNLKRQYDLISRRTRALDELYRNGSLDKTIYEELRSQHISTIDELEEQKKILIESLRTRGEKLEGQIRELELFLANCKMQHSAGEIDPNSYNLAYEAVDNGFKMVLSEKSYLKEIENFLNEVNLQIYENEEKRFQNPTPNTEIADRVVVKMREKDV